VERGIFRGVKKKKCIGQGEFGGFKKNSKKRVDGDNSRSFATGMGNKGGDSGNKTAWRSEAGFCVRLGEKNDKI